MLGYQCGYVAGQFPKFTDEVYWIKNPTTNEEKFMLPTAETALVNIHRDEILTILAVSTRAIENLKFILHSNYFLSFLYLYYTILF